MQVPKAIPAAALALVVALGAAACGNDDSTDTGSGDAGQGSSDVAAATKLVAQHKERVTSFEAPGPPIEGDRSAWAGKTVWYVPITSLPPWFQIQAEVQKSLWSSLGAKLRVCDGKINPTSISACLRQAVDTDAALVITDAIAVTFAQDAYTDVVNAEIPIVAGYTDPETAPTDGSFGEHFHPISGEETLTQQIGVAEMIVASEGKANALVAEVHDTPSSKAASEAATSYLKENCPDCKVTPFVVKNVGNSNLAAEVSGQVLKNPDADYFYTPYEAPSGPVYLQAIRQTGRKMSFMSTAGDIAGLQRVADGTQLGDVGLDPVYQGWNYVDAGLRALAGMPSAEYEGIVRLFTKGDVPENPTFDGWLSGEWYSDLSFEDVYRETWGLK